MSPQKSMSICLEPGCPVLVSRGRCSRHARSHKRSTTPHYYRWYCLERWRYLRLKVLEHEPLCRSCKAQGLITTAHEIDHVVPHEGKRSLFWDESNVQPLCHACHARKTRREQRAT